MVGEAGLGKTALLSSAAAAAERLGIRTLRGTAQEPEHQWPFAAIVCCLGVDGTWADSRRSREAEILRGDGRPGTPGAIGGAGRRIRQRRSAVGLGRRLVCARPPTLLLDELQWADTASLHVVHRPLRSVHQLPLLLFWACRPSPGGVATGSPAAWPQVVAPYWNWHR
ncbi:ATP-binding protein [Streptomyces lydicamycinicus]|uniref:ATP-binding protein n=1 Tax=Streptomyces lydicamycinicus TaxID=1546107 RepID=UPI0032DF844C